MGHFPGLYSTRQRGCFNSVDGSKRLEFVMSWYRLVCSNGLVARVAGVHEAIIHTERAEVPEVSILIRDAIASIEGERGYYSRAFRTGVSRQCSSNVG